MDNEVGDRVKAEKAQELPKVPTISDDDELMDRLIEENPDETNVDESDEDGDG